MYINDYVKTFGIYDFTEYPFNEVDALILCTAIYSNLEVIAPSILDKDAKASYFKDISNFDISVITAGKTLLSSKNKNLIPLMRESRRYSNIGIKYLSKICYPEYANQFYACTFIIPDVGNFIAFRGTDTSITGWLENINIVLNKMVLSQLDALEYLNTISKYISGPIYVGGQSKGGNLSLYSCIHVDKEVQERIVKGYSFDGIGINDCKCLESKEYLRIKDRFFIYAPYKTMVSELLTNPIDRIYVKARGCMLQHHHPHNWKIDPINGRFVVVKDKCRRSYIIHETFDKWLLNVTNNQKKIIINFASDICGERKKTIYEFLYSIRSINRIVYNYRKLTKEDKKDFKEAIKSFMASLKSAKEKYSNKRNKIYSNITYISSNDIDNNFNVKYL